MKRIYIILFLCVTPFMLWGQKVVGKVTDNQGNPIPLALIEVNNGSGDRVLSDDEGTYTITAKIGDVLKVTTNEGQSVTVKAKGNLCNITLTNQNETVQKGFGTTTRKESTQASATVNSERLSKFSVLNPKNALYGVLPGLAVSQNGGTVYANNPTIQLRGLGTFNNASPLVLVDGIERPLERVSVLEIEDVTILKDAAAVAPYGIKGANGVILVTTKRGEYGKMKVDVRYQHGFNTPFRLPKMVDAPTYAQALNEALTNDGLPVRYSPEEIGKFRDGSDPDNYPNVDWQKEAIRQMGQSNELDISFVGGTERVRYFSSINYANDYGLFKDIPSEDGYKTQLNYYKLNIRTNLDVKITPTTQMRINLFGSLDDHNRPNVSPNAIFQRTVNIPAAAFPVKHSNGIWGGNQTYTTQNPVASIAASGFVRSQNRALFADLTLQQELGMLLNGLTAEVSVGYDNLAEYLDTQNRSFAYYSYGQIYNKGKEGLSFSTALNTILMNSQNHVKLNYARMWNNSKLNVMLLGELESKQVKGRNNLVVRQNNVLSASYGLNDRYFIDATAVYSGSSYLSKGDKYRFYPTLSAGWVVSSEKFLKDNATIRFLKLRASYGLSGMDNLDYELDRKFYELGSSYWFGAANTSNTALKEGRLATKLVEPEKAKKFNVGLDLQVFNGLQFSFDFFTENRSNILIDTDANNSSVLGALNAKECIGKVSNKGLEASLAYNGQTGDFRYGATGQFAFSRNKIVYNDEAYQPYSYMYRTGLPIGTYFGLQTNGLFRDAADIASSPEQRFSDVKPGDIKYVNQNGDEVIDQYDVRSLGYSTQYPEIYYGFTLSAEYKGFGVDALFQGIENIQTTRNTPNVHWPMYNNGNISEWYYNGGRWTEDSRETAALPRLSTIENKNNLRSNSLWMADGSYFKLRTLELYYQLPLSAIKPLKMKHCKVFARGQNLFSLDHVGDSDPEAMGAGYPTLRSYSLGVVLGF